MYNVMMSLPLQVFSSNGRDSNESEGHKVWPRQYHVPHLYWDTAGLWQVCISVIIRNCSSAVK